jgi:hypothetical protein
MSRLEAHAVRLQYAPHASALHFLYQVLRTAMQFATVGPLVGGALILAPIMWSEQSQGHLANSAQGVGFLILGILAYSYAFGVVPAALTGGLLGAVRDRGGKWHWRRMAALVGITVGFLCGAVQELLHASFWWPLWTSQAVLLAIPSGLSAWACSYFFRPSAQGDGLADHAASLNNA